MSGLLSWAVRKGLRRGVLGGETPWLVLGAVAVLAQLGLKVLKKRPEVVFSEKLAPGEHLIITHRYPNGHNGRREGPTAQP
ncbi:MAG: hypothetical protein ABSE77_21410 [Acidimicrobiales bacterium]